MKEKSPFLTIIHPTYSFHSSKTTFFISTATCFS